MMEWTVNKAKDQIEVTFEELGLLHITVIEKLDELKYTVRDGKYVQRNNRKQRELISELTDAVNKLPKQWNTF